MEIEYIDTQLLTRSLLAVKIVWVESPTLFWVHIENGAAEFAEMLDELQRWMNRRWREIQYQPDKVDLEEIVAVREGNKWQRGMVTEVDGGDVRIALGDWGRYIWRPHHQCYQLANRFREANWNAVPCGLAYVGPVTNTNRWPRKTIALTKTLAEGKRGWMNIQAHVNPNVAAFINLTISTPTGGDYELAQVLKQLGHLKIINTLAVDVFLAI